MKKLRNENTFIGNPDLPLLFQNSLYLFKRNAIVLAPLMLILTFFVIRYFFFQSAAMYESRALVRLPLVPSISNGSVNLEPVEGAQDIIYRYLGDPFVSRRRQGSLSKKELFSIAPLPDAPHYLAVTLRCPQKEECEAMTMAFAHRLTETLNDTWSDQSQLMAKVLATYESDLINLNQKWYDLIRQYTSLHKEHYDLTPITTELNKGLSNILQLKQLKSNLEIALNKSKNENSKIAEVQTYSVAASFLRKAVNSTLLLLCALVGLLLLSLCLETIKQPVGNKNKAG